MRRDGCTGVILANDHLSWDGNRVKPIGEVETFNGATTPAVSKYLGVADHISNLVTLFRLVLYEVGREPALHRPIEQRSYTICPCSRAPLVPSALHFR
jgi:hypothetical protein